MDLELTCRACGRTWRATTELTNDQRCRACGGALDPAPTNSSKPRAARWARLSGATALALLAIAAPASAAWSPEPATYKIGSTKNMPITMRDGTVLRADVYFPTEAAGKPAPGPFPVIVSETPYNKAAGSFAPALAGYEPYLVERGYIAAVVDVRGTGASGGTFRLFGPDETADSVQVIDWAARLPRSNGRVGMNGDSYVGIDQLFAAAAVGPRSPLKAIFPVVAANDVYRDFFSSGGLVNFESDIALSAVYGALPLLAPLEAPTDPKLLAMLGQHSGALTGFSLESIAQVMSNGDRAYDTAFWHARRPADVLERIVRNRIPAYLVGGLYDVFQDGEPLNFAGLQNAWAKRPARARMASRQKVTGRYQLLMKPNYHSSMESAGINLRPIKLAWFDRWLKGIQTGIDKTRTPLHVALPDGQRLEAAHYPLPQATPTQYYLGAGSTLATSAPTSASGDDTVVFTGASLPCDRSTEQWALGTPQLVLEMLKLSDPCADHDILPSSAGPGQLTYTTAPLKAASVLAGPVTATLYATANTRETEWVVKLSDVAPNGTATDLTQGALLGSFRALDGARSWRSAGGRTLLPHHPFTRASQTAVVPGKVTRYDIGVRAMFATLKAGHRLRLTILTSQLPHLLPIPSQQVKLLGGVYKVQRNAGAASYLNVPLAPVR